MREMMEMIIMCVSANIKSPKYSITSTLNIVVQFFSTTFQTYKKNAVAGADICLIER